VAERRAAHQLLDQPLVFEDPLAVRIIGARAEANLPEQPKNFVAARFRAFMAARSRFAEDELRDAVARGVRQYVILGAGLDTFAYRNPYPELRVFEVDHPSTQAWKRKRLAQVGIPVPSTMTFAPVDFTRETFDDALANAGFDEGARPFSRGSA
jgi:methyltransferase (TIGR00027 family)